LELNLTYRLHTTVEQQTITPIATIVYPHHGNTDLVTAAIAASCDSVELSCNVCEVVAEVDVDVIVRTIEVGSGVLSIAVVIVGVLEDASVLGKNVVNS